jgi:hypothetical protein
VLRRDFDVRIVHLNGPVFQALADRDLATANATSPVPLSDYLAGPECAGAWRMRSRRAEQDPTSAGWVTGIIWNERRQLAVGAAGYHGPPDASGMIEIGYRVDPAYRHRGYTRARAGSAPGPGRPRTRDTYGAREHSARQPTHKPAGIGSTASARSVNRSGHELQGWKEDILLRWLAGRSMTNGPLGGIWWTAP